MDRYKDYMDSVEASDTLHEKLKHLEEPKKKPQPWAKWGAMAAAFALIVGAGAWGLGRMIENTATVSPEVPALGTVVPGREDIPAPEIADIPAPFPEPDIAIVDPNAPFVDPIPPGDRTDGGYEVRFGEGPDSMAAYYVLPYLEWAAASSEVEADYSLAPLGAVQRDMTLDDILLYAGGEQAMADHLLWDGLEWEGTVWFVDESTPCAVYLHADGDGMCFSLEVMKGSSVPSCVVFPDEYYETSQWQGVKITALKNDGAMIGDRVWVQETRIVSFFSNGIGYKLTFRDDNSERANEMCARFVRYAVDGGFHLYALSDEPIYEENMPEEAGAPGYVEPIPALPDAAPQTTPYDPNVTAEAKTPTPPN